MKKQRPKRNAAARALAKPEHRQRIIPDKREKERNRQLEFYVLALRDAGFETDGL
jgi:hypothetical protein